MSHYWFMTANGTLTLDGGWTEEAIDAFAPVAESWEMDGKYGIWQCGKLAEGLCAEFSALFGSYDDSTYSSREYGWFHFSDTLYALDKWTRGWTKRKGSSIHPLSMEQYELLLQAMHDNSLYIRIEYDEMMDEEQEDISEIHYTGTLTSDGKRLIYKECSSMQKTDSWKENGEEKRKGGKTGTEEGEDPAEETDSLDFEFPF